MTEAQSQMEVRSVKLKKKDSEGKEFTPEIVLWDPVRKRNEKFENCSNSVHKDFLKAVSRLAGHMVVLWDADVEDNFERSEFESSFEARGYSIAGREDETRVTIKGHRKTKFAGAITANPTILYNQDMDKDGAYSFIDDLKVKIKAIETETLAYCFDGRAFENPQLSMDMPEGEKVTKAKIATHVDADPSMSSPEQVAAAIVKETNAGKDIAEAGKKRKRVAQTASNKSGIVE